MHKPISFEEINHRSKKSLFEDARRNLPAEGYLRLWQIVGVKGCPAILPISKSSFWAGVREGRFPQPIKLGKRTTCWRVRDIRALIESEVVQ
jgi:predicted DNA-binding transcriptional regulator AlpA